MFEFMLFIGGYTKSSLKAVENLKSILDTEYSDQYTLGIVDLFENPELSYKFKVFATPTVIKLQPSPIRRIFGDLSNKENVLKGLELM